MKTLVLLLLLPLSLGGCALQLDPVTSVDPQTGLANTAYSLNASALEKSDFELRGRGLAWAIDPATGQRELVHADLLDVKIGKDQTALTDYLTVRDVTGLIQRGLTSRAGIDAGVRESEIAAGVDHHVIDGARVINPETQAVHVVRP